MNDVGKLININQSKGLPRKYKFKQFIRWFTLLLGTAAIVYALWVIFAKLNADSPKFFKFAPFAILFLALNSVLKNFFTLNSILFTKDAISFHFLGKKSTKILWKNLKKMEFSDDKRKHIILRYSDGSSEKEFSFSIAFPNMLEIVNSIAEMCPDLEYDEFMQNVIINDKEKKAYQKKLKSEE
ncbi:MAG: hypothetical protein K9N09_00670 [Candidatus Cloacimonetes bacterium]|nr:hypothetical protein [Candidatus Cloacimonadota bacterium]MCF7813072.1 hypothetical protein [Candidatus Cloacimonadota bacterium]MCF7867187.1 hypothetical protein [Candidatus Cloacimonadota bacterium]MCF7882631.1 hypothetical protein [Candidatus Cloacimonadota bacterium]